MDILATLLPIIGGLLGCVGGVFAAVIGRISKGYEKRQDAQEKEMAELRTKIDDVERNMRTESNRHLELLRAEIKETREKNQQALTEIYKLLVDLKPAETGKGV